ncbi:hypothetical protein U1Q18_017149, partial [Sarracenia purpurea var. burkii]
LRYVSRGYGRDLRAHNENACSRIALDEIICQAKNGAIGKAALLVQHESLDEGSKTK